ncbi:hypothetical protein ACFQL1_14595 [Halomicroarcula sp. GCM10025709]|uniref:DUF7526 family protein n=1 Tax=Haloarcula TaxID=2237 RepID=UPI0024C414C3|nr:hypothetical protein [Halomicroarcula sp. YJ-61-S]
MTERIRGEVIHVVEPADLDDYDLQPELRELADSQYVLVCREGGTPSWIERLRSFLLRQPIEPVTLVAERGADEGEEVTARVRETEMAGVYEATRLD